MNNISITQKQHKNLIAGYKELYKSNTDVDIDDNTLSLNVAEWLDNTMKKSLTDNKVKSTLERLNTQVLNLKDKILNRVSKYDSDEHKPSGIVKGKKGEWFFNPDY